MEKKWKVTIDDLIDYVKEDELACSSGYGQTIALYAVVHFYKKKIFYKVSCKKDGKSWEYSFTNLDEAVDYFNEML